MDSGIAFSCKNILTNAKTKKGSQQMMNADMIIPVREIGTLVKQRSRHIRETSHHKTLNITPALHSALPKVVEAFRSFAK